MFIVNVVSVICQQPDHSQLFEGCGPAPPRGAYVLSYNEGLGISPSGGEGPEVKDSKM